MRRGIRKLWATAPGAPGKGPEKFLNKDYRRPVFRILTWWRRGDWYIRLRDVGTIVQQSVTVKISNISDCDWWSCDKKDGNWWSIVRCLRRDW